MSKFLKFIVNLFLTLAIIVTAGIIIPPLLGVNTTIVDTAGMDTNLSLGSVTYSRDKAVLDLEAGDEILKESGSSTYAYIIQEGDATSGEFKVVSATEPEASPETIILRNTVSEVVLTVPYIGFVVVAMQSIEGRIIIALVILFIIILFVLSELWKKKDDEEEDEDVETSGSDDNKALGESAAFNSSEAAAPSKEDDKLSIEDAMSNLSVAKANSEEEINLDQVFAENLDPEKKTASSEFEEVTDSAARTEETETNSREPAPDTFETADSDKESGDEPDYSNVGDVTGDTRVFPSALAPLLNSQDAVGTDSDSGATKIIPDLEPYLQVEDTALPKEEELIREEPKSLWSWTDEPFENENEGDGFFGISSGRPASAEEYPERFAPVERMSRQEIINQAKSGGSEPKIRRDDVTGIEIIDYSDLL